MGYYEDSDRKKKKPLTATELTKQISDLEFRLETEALKFSEEKKIRSTIKELKKQIESIRNNIHQKKEQRTFNLNREAKEAPEKDLTTDYSEIIKKARLKRQMTQEQFSAMLNEKMSVYQKWENGSLKPSLDVAEKLEKILKVKLIVDGNSESANPEDIIKSLNPVKGSKAATLGDLVKVKVRNR